MDRRVEKTKAIITRTYIDMLMEGKEKRITISELARRANIDRKTFYLHYESIEDIARDFAKSRVDEIIAKVKQENLVNQSFSALKLFELLNEVVEEDMAFFRFIILHKEYDYFFDKIREILATEIVTNYHAFFGYPEEEFAIYAEFYISGIVAVYIKWIREGQKIPKEALAMLVGQASYGGLHDLLPNFWS